MMNLHEKAMIMHYHRHRVATFSAGSVEALGWTGVPSQQLRFDALCEIGDLSGKTVLDVGCGYGDLKDFLDQSYHGFAYIGIDQIAEFVLEARRRHGHRPSCYFCIADAATEELPVVDFVLASGVLNYRCERGDYALRLIEKMYACGRLGLAFNMLDAEKFPGHPLLAGRQRSQVLDWCHVLSPSVQVVDGYLDDDFTVIMKHLS